MRISIIINDDTIREDVESMVSDLIESEDITVPENDASEFIADITETIIDKYCNYADYSPNYENEVLDMAESYGYTQ